MIIILEPGMHLYNGQGDPFPSLEGSFLLVWDFLSHVVKTPIFQCKGVGSIPGQELRSNVLHSQK